MRPEDRAPGVRPIDDADRGTCRARGCQNPMQWRVTSATRNGTSAQMRRLCETHAREYATARGVAWPPRPCRKFYALPHYPRCQGCGFTEVEHVPGVAPGAA